MRVEITKQELIDSDSEAVCLTGNVLFKLLSAANAMGIKKQRLKEIRFISEKSFGESIYVELDYWK